MKNAHQDGRVINVTLTANVDSGDVVAMERIFGIAVASGKIGETIGVMVEGVFRLPKNSSAVIANGLMVVWDVSLGQVVPSSETSGDIENFGYATEAAGSGVTEVLVRLCPGHAVARTTTVES